MTNASGLGERRRPPHEQVEHLAKQTGHVIAVAQKMFQSEYERLREDAKVTDFVVVLALRHTREKLLALQKHRRARAPSSTYELFSA